MAFETPVRSAMADVVLAPKEALDLCSLVVSRLVLRHSAIPIGHTTTSLEPGGSVRITTDIKVPDRETGEEKWLFHSMSIDSVPRARSVEFVLGEVERHLRSIYDHEFREALHLDGRRIYDPHHAVGELFGDVRIVAVKRLAEKHRKQLTLENGRTVEV